jgi:hypothetical protein
MAYRMATTHWNTPSDILHGVSHGHLASMPSCYVARIRFAFQQTRYEKAKSLFRTIVGSRCRRQTADGLYTMVDGTNAS